MPSVTNKYLPYLVLGLLSVPLFFLNIYDVHSWGDDFSQYIKEAMNIATGKPYYQSNYIFNPTNSVYAPPQYPPGFPLMLAPIVKAWGLSFTAMCYFNSFLTACLLFALYAYFRKHMGIVTAICLAVLICYSGIILDLKRNILADIPCLLFTTLYLWYRTADRFNWRRIALLVFFIVMAIQIRSQAMFLLAAEAGFLFLSFIKFSVKEKKIAIKSTLALPPLYILGGAVLLNLLVSKVIFYSPLSTTGFYNNFIDEALKGDLKTMAGDYMIYVLNTISSLFHYDTYSGFPKAAAFFIAGTGMVFGVIGFIMNICKRLSVDDLFFALMCVVILFYPVRDPRYFLPVIPIVYYYCYTVFKAIIPAITRIDGYKIAIVLTLIFLRTGFGYIKRSATEIAPGCIPQQKDKTALQYISANVKDNEIIVFTKPRMLTLFTNKKSMNVSWQLSPEMNKRIMDSMNVKYMLVVDGLDDDYFKTYLRDVQRPTDSARISEGYTLYTLR